ncbi:hypothetical protein HNY73_017618 [Argiope bruennichi]|uniref:Uncharacterized protein n=1 Tax=Argiope bruennichi TaxID=94029 RepID=A0A8T0EE93_ARGBR|nr:hypothetical protein HNY73_017618 [Argiope bruennichi]
MRQESRNSQFMAQESITRSVRQSRESSSVRQESRIQFSAPIVREIQFMRQDRESVSAPRVENPVQCAMSKPQFSGAIESRNPVRAAKTESSSVRQEARTISAPRVPLIHFSAPESKIHFSSAKRSRTSQCAKVRIQFIAPEFENPIRRQ